jgi:hypothetical protein
VNGPTPAISRDSCAPSQSLLPDLDLDGIDWLIVGGDRLEVLDTRMFGLFREGTLDD